MFVFTRARVPLLAAPREPNLEKNITKVEGSRYDIFPMTQKRWSKSSRYDTTHASTQPYRLPSAAPTMLLSSS